MIKRIWTALLLAVLAVWRFIGVRGFLLFVVLGICALLVWFQFFRAEMIAGFFANQQMPSVTISATKIEPVTWTPEIEAIGTLLAAQGVDVAAETAGRVESIEFEASQPVQAGELLVQIDDAIERADLAAAEATVARDQAQLERAQRLRETGVSSEQSLEEAQTAFAASASALARIEAVLDQKAIEAPFAGMIGIPRIEEGEYLQVGTIVATLQQLATMKVDFTVPEQRIHEIGLQQTASFGLTEDSFPYNGRITGIDPKIDPQTRLVSVRAEVDNSGGMLRPGQFVRVRVSLPPVENVIALPQTAVVTSLYGDYVYVVEEAGVQASAAAADQPAAESAAGEAAPAEEAANAPALPPAPAEGTPPEDPAAAASEKQLMAKQAFVQLGRRQGNQIEIVGGLKPGQTVVTSGQNKLANNTPVVINNEVDPAALALELRDGGS